MLNDEALNAEEVAEILHVSRKTVYALAKSGELGSYKIGRKLFFALRDVQRYLAQNRHSSAPAEVHAGAVAEGPSSDESGEEGPRRFIVAGNGIAADLIADRLNAAGLPAMRTYHASYQSLVDVYRGFADAALVHLYDQRTNSYNVPFVQRLAPGIPVAVFHLVKRWQGFAVAKGNPKGIKSWGALLKEGVRLANRMRGCGSRILLDEKLLAMEALPESIDGYGEEYPSGLAAAEAVALGAADVAVVGEQVMAQVPGADFVPLQAEWLDLAVAKRPHTRPYVRRIRDLMNDEAFKSEYSRIVSSGDPASLGAIVYEC